MKISKQRQWAKMYNRQILKFEFSPYLVDIRSQLENIKPPDYLP